MNDNKINVSLIEDNESLLESADIDNLERRELFQKLGGFAAYTAPTLLLLLSPRSGHSGSILDAPPAPPDGTVNGF